MIGRLFNEHIVHCAMTLLQFRELFEVEENM